MQTLALDRHGWLRPGLSRPGLSRHSHTRPGHSWPGHSWPDPSVQCLPSPNADARPAGVAVSLLVIHNISLPPNRFDGPCVADLFLNRLDYGAHPWLERLRGLRVSAHFFVRRDGGVLQFVSTEDRAWHAGASHFRGRERCNDFSIGIEVEGADTVPYDDRQYETLSRLVPLLRSRYPLTHVRGHEHIAPGRKTDPGPAFDWLRLGHESGYARRSMPPF